MIISRSHATKLARQGKATLDGYTMSDGQRYQVVIRHDLHRVDHYRLYSGQPTRVAVHTK